MLPCGAILQARNELAIAYDRMEKQRVARPANPGKRQTAQLRPLPHDRFVSRIRIISTSYQMCGWTGVVGKRSLPRDLL